LKARYGFDIILLEVLNMDDNKIYDMFEKIYIELTSFKQDMSEFRDETNKRLTKLEIGQEQMNDKVSEAFEAIHTLAETNDRQHEEIMKELRGEINVVEFAVKRLVK